MKMSENTCKVLEYLKGIHGKKNVTSADVAEELGLEKRTVDGVFTGLQKKGLGARVEAEATGTAEISFLSLTEEGKTADYSEMSETVKAIVDYLTKNTEQVTLDTLSEGINVPKRSANGSFNALVKKGLCVRTPVTVEAPVTVKLLTLTDAGLAFDPDAAEDAE